jgi:hypothetical protein
MAFFWTAVAVLAAFCSSFLLFAIQPVIGRIFLPFLGGSPAVWNTCMMFFQMLLLAGYLYSHYLSSKVRPALQGPGHLIVWAFTLIILPIGLPVSLIDVDWITERPVYWMLFALLATVGPCFFFLACMSPLIQSWYHRLQPGKNPYALFAASNTGSLLALLAYPLLFEATFSVSDQARFWSFAYVANGLILALLVSKVFVVSRGCAPAADSAAADDELQGSAGEEYDIDEWVTGSELMRKRWLERCWWFVLAFVPSSLMLGVTGFLTTDVAAIPMLWVLPLTLYLLTYILAFGRYGQKSDRLMTALLPGAVALLLFFIFAEYRKILWLCMTAHLSLFFVIALAVHGRLSLIKPEAKRLTEFYVVIAAGGMMGGIFNAMIAPHVFTTLAEYPLVAALGLMPLFAGYQGSWRRSAVLVPLAAAAGIGMLLFSDLAYDKGWFGKIIPPGYFTIDDSVLRISMLFGIPLVLLPLIFRNGRYAAAGLIGFAALGSGFEPDNNILYRDRSIYGALTVKRYDYPQLNTLVHGGILHGEQRIDSPEARLEPRSYYHREGPLGQVMDMLKRHRPYPRIAALGMGTGSIAAYGTPQNAITFYELDPHIAEVAQNPKYFSYIDDCRRRWCNLQIVMGDARLKLIQSEETYDAVIVDAFSSDSIPVHLITREAVENYLEKMDEGAMLVFHISNRYVNLEPVLLGIARDLNLGFALRTETDDSEIGKGASTWVVLAREDGMFDELYADERWGGLIEKDGVGLWTDDYAALIRVFTWF